MEADGGIELSFAEKGGVSLGAEVTKGLGVKVPLQGERKLVLCFDRPADLLRALQATAVLGIGVPAMIAERAKNPQKTVQKRFISTPVVKPNRAVYSSFAEPVATSMLGCTVVLSAARHPMATM